MISEQRIDTYMICISSAFTTFAVIQSEPPYSWLGIIPYRLISVAEMKEYSKNLKRLDFLLIIKYYSDICMSHQRFVRK